MSLLSNTKNNRGSIQSVFVLLLLAVFAGMSTVLVVLGGRVYRNTVATAEEHNQIRVISAMVRSAVWAEDGISEISTEDFDGTPILTIRSIYDDEVYYKRLYAFEGFLWESFSSEEYTFELSSGETVCPIASFVPSIIGNMLKVEIEDVNGQADSVFVSLKSEHE